MRNSQTEMNKSICNNGKIVNNRAGLVLFTKLNLNIISQTLSLINKYTPYQLFNGA